jgi:hypothetical protein
VSGFERACSIDGQQLDGCITASGSTRAKIEVGTCYCSKDLCNPDSNQGSNQFYNQGFNQGSEQGSNKGLKQGSSMIIFIFTILFIVHSYNCKNIHASLLCT